MFKWLVQKAKSAIAGAYKMAPWIGTLLNFVPPAKDVTCACGDFVCKATKGYGNTNGLVEGLGAEDYVAKALNGTFASLPEAICSIQTKTGASDYIVGPILLFTAMGVGYLCSVEGVSNPKDLAFAMIKRVFPKLTDKELETARIALNKAIELAINFKFEAAKEKFARFAKGASEEGLGKLREDITKEVMDSAYIEELLQKHAPQLNQFMQFYKAMNATQKPKEASKGGELTLASAERAAPALDPMTALADGFFQTMFKPQGAASKLSLH